MKITGKCHCGAISFTAEIDPDKVVACHCTDCQVLSGSPFRVVVPAPIETFELEGTPKVYVKVADSGNRRQQNFCPECGSAIFGGAAENMTMAIIRLGCVDQRAQLQPKRQIWQHSAMPWLGELGDVPAFERER